MSDYLPSTVIEKPALKKPPMYAIVLLNDDFTPMEFVVEVLARFFQKNTDEATKIMLAVHYEGKGFCGKYARDVAESKIECVHNFSRQHGHPLLCIMEEEHAE